MHDALAAPAAATEWLRATGPSLPGQGSDLEAEVDQLRRLRDALRRLAAELTDDPWPAAASAIPDRRTALAVLNQTCALAPAWAELAWPGSPSRRWSSSRDRRS